MPIDRSDSMEVPQDNRLWDDIHAQTRIETYQVPASAWSGTNRESVAGRGETILPVDSQEGLGRDEVAELVAIEVDSAHVNWRGLDTIDADTPGSVNVEFDITGTNDTDQGKVSLVSKTESNGVFENVNEIKDNSLLKLVFGATQPWSDETTGDGGGADVETVTGLFKNFRKEFGHGPIFDDRDELGNGYAIETDEVQNIGVDFFINYRLYWDVFELETRRVTDVM